MNPHLDPTQSQFTPEEKQVEKALRPKSLDDFSGQPRLVDNLKVFIQAAKLREEALDHVLLHGPPGLGKTTLSHIIANEMEADIKMTSGPVWIREKYLYWSYLILLLPSTQRIAQFI